MVCTKVSDWTHDLSQADECPVCGNNRHLRPHIVWVGEEPRRLDTVYLALANCELFLSIGNGGGEPGLSFLAEAQRAGARTIEFAAEPTPLSPEFREAVHGLLTKTVPAWIKQTVAQR